MKQPKARGTFHQPRQAREWAVTVREWRRSGMKASAFCHARGLTLKTFEWWRWALLSGRTRSAAARPVTDQQSSSAAPVSAVPARTPPAFVEVLPSAPRARREITREDTAGVEVVLRHGRRVRVDRDFDGAALRRVVAILEEV